MNKVFPLPSSTSRERGSTDMMTGHQAVKELAAHFRTEVPRLSRSRSRGACYIPIRKTIKWGMRSSRGIDSLLHEFAHHLQREPQYAELKPEGRALRPNYWSGEPRKARSIHGPDFFAALLAVTTFAYGNAKHFSWANEYKSIAAKFKRQYGESFDVTARHDITRVPSPIRIVLGAGFSFEARAAAAPVAAPIAAAPMPKKASTSAQRAAGNRAWAPPSEANNWEGGCLWRWREAKRTK